MSEQLRTRLAIAGMTLTVILVWILQHPYLGIENNDSALYSMLALARLHPESLGSDVFLRFGSQDSYTLFSPLFASAIRWFDLEPAAAALAFAGQVIFIVCCWLLARSVMPRRLAFLSIGLLIALPSNYGVAHSFNYMESFLTPRQLAEAATLAALAANVTRRYAIAALCLSAAMVLHPIMALGGIVILACLHVALPRPRLAVVAAGVLALGSLAIVLVAPRGIFAPFDSEWLSLVTSGAPYLFLSHWDLDDWAHVSLAITVLVLGTSTAGTPEVRKLCLAALLTAACSFAVSALYVDLLHSVIFTQAQPWRWLWLVESLATLLLPLIVPSCWLIGRAGRSAVLLLGAAWMLSTSTADPHIAWACIALALSACVAVRWDAGEAGRSIFFGSCALLAGAVACNFAFKLQYLLLDTPATVPEHLLSGRALQIWGGDGVLYVLALVTAWWLVGRQRSGVSALLLCLASGTACWILVPLAWQSWTHFHYTSRLQATFVPWREIIPRRAQVVWPQNPMGTWYLLDRPSYYSGHQVAGDVFSRAKAIEIHRRADLVRAALKSADPDPQGGRDAVTAPLEDIPAVPPNADNLNAKGLATLCADPELDFYVSWTRVSPTPVGVIVPNPAKPRNRLHLYRCADFRTAG